MAENFGILISENGKSTINASNSQIILNTANPFIKIDTQNKQAFLTIELLITTDPPEPVSPATNTYTTLYQFAHGYSYMPSIEALFYVQSIPPGSTFTQDYFQDSGQLGGHTTDDGAFLYAIADNTNVYIIVNKFNDQGGGGMANLLTGTNIEITLHVFVEEGYLP